MAARRVSGLSISMIALAGLSVPLVSQPVAFAQDMPVVENTKYTAEGEITADSVAVHSGPQSSFYPTMRLDRGTKVKVVGIKYNWLKIQPPKGSFSLIPKLYVQRHGDGSVGKVIEQANVRAGSSLTAGTTAIQTSIAAGKDVQILDEQDEYFKIVPPEGAYVYVEQKYVRAIPNQAAPKPAQRTESGTGEPSKPEVTGTSGSPERTTTPEDNGTSRPAPAAASGDVKSAFDKAEAAFNKADKLPVAEQPLEQLTKDYQALSKNAGLTTYMKRVVDARLTALKLRSESRKELAQFRESRQASEKLQKDLAAEREELQERIDSSAVKVYTAVGVLRPSSLQVGGETLYRLTDPETSRTVVYIRGDDPKITSMLNQFVGVRGELAGDPQLSLRVINNPAGIESVDQTKVNGSVAAQVIPPSLLPKVPVADTAPQTPAEGQ